MIRDSLCLDHFYIGFTAAQIEDLKRLTRILQRCVFRKVQSGKDQWQGVYLYTNLGSYFEMILDPAEYGFGVACSAHAIQYVDIRKIKTEWASLSWRSHSRKWQKTSKTWFDWLTLKPFKGNADEYQPFYSWIMHYHPLHVKERVQRPVQSSIDRFQYLHLKMGGEWADYVKYHSQWLPGSVRSNRNGAELVLPNRDSGSFHVEIEYLKGRARPTLHELQMTLCPGVAFRPVKLDFFTLRKSGETLTLSANATRP